MFAFSSFQSSREPVAFSFKGKLWLIQEKVLYDFCDMLHTLFAVRDISSQEPELAAFTFVAERAFLKMLMILVPFPVFSR